ncbi:MAG: response regulator [Chitinophagaceae bacterium]|nr:response regulator [Chitinophagaceae bacterium]
MNLKPLKNMEILLVEDNEMNTLLASAIIRGTGANVTEADNGMDAIHLLRSRTFDLVLMDLHLPVMDGFETTRYIRTQLSLNVPIIAITANVVNNEGFRCKDVGMNGFISKPYTEQELLEAIANCATGSDTGYGAGQVQHSGSSTALYNLSFLESVSKGNHNLLRQMLLVFVEQTPAAVAQIREAYDKHDFAEIYANAHRIKPDIDNLNIASLKDDIRRIEGFAAQKQNGDMLKNLILKLDNTIKQVVHHLNVNVLAR